MAERRKIVIPTGAEDSGPLETPHFDTEAARSARPVVPLATGSGELVEPLPPSVHFTQSVPVTRAKVSPWLVGLVILAAMSVGAAGALALDYYRNHKHEEAQAAIQPSDAAVAAEEHPAGSPLEESSKVDSPAAIPVTVNVKKAERSPSPASDAATVAAATEKAPEPVARPKSPAAQPERSAREERKSDEKQAEARDEARRDRQKDAADGEGSDDPYIRRPGKRQRHPRDIEVRPEDIPPQLKRANQELHRIREIFEGTRP